MPPAPPLPDLLPVFNAQPGATLLLSPEWVIVAASDDYLAATLTQRDTIVGQYIFDAFPDNPDTPEANAVSNVRASLTQVLATRQPHEMAPQHYDVPDRAQPGRFVERHWLPRHTPVLDAAGQVQFIIQSVQDVTASRLAERLLRESQANEQAARAETEAQRQRLHEVLMALPAQVVTYRGPDHVYELVNPRYQQLMPTRLFQGLPVRQALPELEGQGIFERLDHVYRSGESHFAPELETWVDLTNTGHLEQRYFSVLFQALHDAEDRIDGILNFAYDITEQVLIRRQLQQLNQDLEARVQQRTREAEAARAEAEEQRNRLERLFQQTPAHINIFSGPDHVWTLVHPSTQATLGNRRLQGLTRRQALPELPEDTHEPFDRVYRTGQPEYATETVRRLDRFQNGELQEVYFDATFQPLFNTAGEIEGVMSFAVNVTDRVYARREAESLQAQVLAAAQRQAQEREAFHNVFEQTPALIALLRDPGHRFEYVNPAFRALLPGRQVVGLEMVAAVPETQDQGFIALLDRVYQTGETFFGAELPFALTSADGLPSQPRYYNFTYQAYRESGRTAGVTIFAFDVTQQVLARQAQETERQRLLHLFQQAPAGICILAGPDLVYEFVNPGYQLLLPGRVLLGLPILEALPELVGTPIAAILQGVYATGQPHAEQALPITVARPADGTLEDRHFTFVYQPRRNERGEVDGVLAFVFEVTEQVRARQQAQVLASELSAANEQLMRTNVDLDNFIYTASHDLKAPISNIEGLLYVLQEELPADVAQDAQIGPTLTRMLDAVERFKRTIDHLTDVSKLQKEHSPAISTIDLPAVIEGVRQDLLPLLEETNAKLVVDVSGLPSIHFSEKNLRSVVYNLLSNALKYHSPDRLPRVDIRAHVRPGFSVLEVHDNGLGISAEHLPQLFTMFQRFHDHVEGTGIGLYMVKRMVENAGGRIEVHSQLGAGTTFFVHLPQTEVPTA